ncbi:MAG: class I mannose-6-phosphate isomerase [Bacteroidales bacterium]|nr:class I mannose-6-phosphate isomerase [Bacteroidales bacterium]
MNKLYPLKFIPDARERIWGGDYLAKKLGKPFDEDFAGKPVGESWELWSLYGGSSVVQNGFLAGNTLDELMEIYLGDLVGESVYNWYKGDFPVLVKILDIKDKISVQVHPGNEIAFERENSYGKAELWYVMEASEDAKLYVGFNKDVTPVELYEKCKDGTVKELLNCITPKKGDCLYIQPGCVHSAEGEVVIAEIQQSSDISYRLYDWGRENNPATARRIDLEDAIDVIDYSKFEKENFYFSQVGGNTTIADTTNFIVKTVELQKPVSVVPSLAGSFTVYMCIEGEAALKMNDNSSYMVSKGETILVPASMDDFTLVPVNGTALLLEITMPQLTDEPDTYLNYDEPEDEAHGSYKDSVSEISCDGETFDDDDEDEDEEHGHNCGCGHHHHHDCDCGGHHSHDCGCGSHSHQHSHCGLDAFEEENENVHPAQRFMKRN